MNWFVTTLIKTPGHAPAETMASAAILNQIRMPGGIALATQQLIEARRKDPLVHLWPEVTVDIIGADHVRAGEIKEAIELFKLNLLAYPDSADAHNNLADAYLKDGQEDLARQFAEKGMALLDSHTAPASSWSDTEERRGEVRSGLQDVLLKARAAPTTARPAATSRLVPGTVFRDCPDCPEMLTVTPMHRPLAVQSNWETSACASIGAALGTAHRGFCAPPRVSETLPTTGTSLWDFA